ncbi:transposase family protein [Palleronia sp. LCG004]|uniref:transposase family protein n=1 Tax=Palleronia sp. LCG004 TaxID=3079304 RepID=UPI002942F7C2|nr:transposase family protein [Palleronia sp. LCG004]WOI56707.1 transposase family protein [Palleronia sp. LCG004]
MKESGFIFSTWHYPKRAKSLFHGWNDGLATISVPDDDYPGSFTFTYRSEEEAREVFLRRRSIADLDDVFNLTRPGMRRFLAGMQINREDEICRNRAEGMSLAKIAKLHRTGAATVKGILEHRGFEIRPGNTLKREPSTDDLLRAKAEGKSINAIAKQFGVHWMTIKRRLDDLD